MSEYGSVIKSENRSYRRVEVIQLQLGHPLPSAPLLKGGVDWLPTHIAKGIELLSDKPGSGTEAVKGSSITYNVRFFLRRGNEVTLDAKSIALYGARLTTPLIDGARLIDHETTLGKRQSIVGA